MSQNRNAADRAGVIEGSSKSDRDEDRRVAHLIAMTNPNEVL
ncbi:putative FMN-binding regulatory protein PaiB [Bradyrhizobium sp. LM2.9]